ncbi:unnamed protein product [Schistocephalus solidus]|uniref:ABC transporter domain-containing protein n=1 Tax=Schistocephalus solidus TaxID=70667 RepID=A0A183T4H5_SCHSO|nr:unnamed protein product [Schistocephalus solidus]
MNWPKRMHSLLTMTIYFPEGQSTAIVGRVGSGKSSLLNALLGNMERISGRVNIKGSIAYVAQQAWIFNGTLRDNILFHKPFDAERYERILSACALQQDLTILPSGDLTLIGDKGINLSGGQKQRISIARACYSEADVYLFDDPLAAVDAEVASHLLREVLGRHGLLAKKTRIIATHHPKLIQNADRIAMLEAGRLVEYGTYSKLTQSCNSRLNVFLISREAEEVEEAGMGSEVTTLNPHMTVGSSLLLFSLLGYLALAVGNIRAVKSLHAALLNCILRVPTSFFDTVYFYLQGRVVNRFSSDVAAVDNQLMNSLRSSIQTSLQCLVTFALTASLSPWIIIPLFFLSIFYFNVFVATSRQLKRIDSVSKSPIFSHFSETLLGVDTIRAYGLGSLFVEINAQRLDTNNMAVFAAAIANRWLAVLLETVGNVLTGLVAFASVATKGHLSAGFAGLVVSYALNLTQTLNWLVRMTAELESNIVCVERIKEYSELPLEAPWEVEDKPAVDWPQGGIEFVNYGTRYRPDLDPVLRSITCSIKPGEKIGIVGRTGSGKSSLVLGLFRVLEPAEGHIFIDGLDVSNLGLHDLRGRITLIPQDPVLFSGTLRFNLDPFNSYDDVTVWEALRLADLKSFVEELAGDAGLDMPVSEGGSNLSQGQRQLVCLARALLRRSKILVLDEATAAVDPQTDQLIQTTVRREFTSSTVLTIAHRLNTILDYDSLAPDLTIVGIYFKLLTTVTLIASMFIKAFPIF